MAKTTVIWDNRFAEFDRKLTRAVADALDEAGQIIAQEAQGADTRGYQISKIVGSGHVGPVEQGRRGLEVAVGWTDWRAHFFDKGTYAKKGRKRSRRAADVEGNRGIRPVRFKRRGLRHAVARLPDLIAGRMP